jgi:hypothetical protein
MDRAPSFDDLVRAQRHAVRQRSHSHGTIERAIAGAVGRRVGAMLTLADAFLWSERSRIVAAAARPCLPGMYPEVDCVEAGGLMAYGPNIPDKFLRAADT